MLPLVVRAGGGSVRDTLSLLDQLIAGSEGTVLAYERAVALLGYTHSSLLGEVIDALGARDAAAAFGVVDRVIQTGQDPRRFVEDLLERLRDLIIVAATGAGAGAVLRGTPQDELESMTVQAARFGTAELSRTADVVGAALTELTGATSPRLHLELMIARVLVPESDDTERGTLARVERLERRVGVVGVEGVAEPAVAAERPSEPVRTAPPAAPKTPAPTSTTAPINEAAPAPAPAPSTTPVTSEQLVYAWPQVLEAVSRVKRTAWAVVVTARPMGYKDDVLALAFPSENDANSFRELRAPGDSVSEILRNAIQEVLGVRVKFLARVDAAARRPAANADESPPPQDEPPADAEPDPVDIEPQDEPRFTTSTSWAVAEIPGAETAASTSPVEPEPAAEPAKPTTPTVPAERQRYGEAVVREVLRASFIEEEELTPRVTPTEAS